MADISSWNVELGATKIDPNEKLFLFGYSCKLFPQDEKAAYIENGQHLIPWMGDKTLMIDRYDVRGYLHDLKQYEPKPGGYDHSSDEEKHIDEERYHSLRTDMTEEQLYQEEELKRLRAAIAGDGAYHEIGFSYDNPDSDKAEESSVVKVEDPEDDLYEIPEGLKVPKGLEVPYNMKIHAIIEKTATFVSEQGGQMEIIIKMKQQANPQFGFMHLDNPLHPYYKHLLKEIKSGSYKPVPVRRVSRSEDEDDDGHYLHPSLMSGKANDVPIFTVPTINFRRSDDDSYSLLVKNLQQHRMEETPPAEVLEKDSDDDSKPLPADCSQQSNDLHNLMVLQSHHIVPPPPDIQPIINKMAEYVIKNGADFETLVKGRKDKRFEFLDPGHEYHNYYVYQKENGRRQANGSSNKQKVLETAPSSEPQLKGMESSTPLISPASDTDVSSENTSSNCKDADSESVNSHSTTDDDDALYSQDLQGTPSELQQMGSQDSSDSLDFLNSPSDVIEKEESKPKLSKVMKGPISFSLKAKESETSAEKSKLTPVLLDDDSDEDNPESLLTDKEESVKLKNYSDVYFNYYSKPIEEPKVQKPKDEALEAKLAEERAKDKLIATARERLANQRKEKQLQLEQQQRAEQLKKEKQQHLEQQKKEKELQLERKRKAALFLNMLQRRDPDSTVAAAAVPALLKNTKKNDVQDGKITKITEFWSLPDTSVQPTPDPGILFPLNKIIISTEDSGSTTIIPGIKTDWLDANSDGSVAEDPSSRVSDKQSSDSDKNIPAKPERKKKRKRKSRSRSRDRSRSDRSSKSSRRNKDKHHSKSPPKHYKLEKSKREKQLPAAYANINRSRSRSRSPRRYRSMPTWRRR